MPARSHVRIAALIAFLSLNGSALLPQRPVRATPTYARLVSADSLDISDAAVSPEGRVVVFQVERRPSRHLWIVEAGGRPRPLTSGEYRDEGPTWFPDGGRIAFTSNRGAPDVVPVDRYVMTLDVASRTSAAADVPRRVTLGGGQPSQPAVSPDGERIAYAFEAFEPHGPAERWQLRVVPARGGREAVLFAHSERIWDVTWSGDGRYLVFAVEGARRDDPFTIFRIRSGGGPPEPQSTVTPYPETIARGGGRYVREVPSERPTAVASRAPGPREMVTLRGEMETRFTLHPRMKVVEVAPGGRELVVVRRDADHPAFVTPVAGGPPRPLHRVDSDDQVVGWSADTRVAVRTSQNGEDVLLLIDPATGSAKEFPFPACAANEPIAIGLDGRVLMCHDAHPTRSEVFLRVFDLTSSAQRAARPLAAPAPLAAYGLSGAGGTLYRDGPDFVYAEQRDDSIVVRRMATDGAETTIAVVQASGVLGIGVHGRRVAFVRSEEEGVALYVGEDRRRRRLTSSTGETLPFASVAWSPDGQHVATTLPGALPMQLQLVVVRVSDAEVRQLSNRVMAPLQLQWRPDGSAIIESGFGPPGRRGVALVSLDPAASAIQLLDALAVPVLVSPDGRLIAYAVERLRGSSIWQVELAESGR